MKLATFLAYAALVAWMSLTPGAAGGLPLWDKAGHFTSYALLLLLGSRLCLHHRQLLIMVAIVFVYGALIEIGQYFVPGRDASSLDLLANTVGIAVAFFAVRAITPHLKLATGTTETLTAQGEPET